MGAVGELHDHTRGWSAEANELALVASPCGASRAAEVERLEQVRLADAVGAVDYREARAEVGFGASVGAEIAQLHAEHAHRLSQLRRLGEWA